MQFPMILNEKGLRLEKTEKGVLLTDGKMELFADFREMLPRLRRGNLSGEMLVKAARVKKENPVLWDATAGLGQDSLLLAAAGFTVVLFEKDPVIASLLKDALVRAGQEPELRDIAGSMQLVEGDSIAARRAQCELRHKENSGFPQSDCAGEEEACLKTASAEDGREKIPHSAAAPDVILLDPMFPERTKSALVKKKFQLLHEIERPCADEEELLSAAIALRPKKIVIKRPLKGPFLAGRKPDYSLSGKAIRYDCIVFA